MQNAVLDSWGAYNQRRYGCPWVCVMRADGSYNFEPRVGTYTGNARQGRAAIWSSLSRLPVRSMATARKTIGAAGRWSVMQSGTAPASSAVTSWVVS